MDIRGMIKDTRDRAEKDSFRYDQCIILLHMQDQHEELVLDLQKKPIYIPGLFNDPTFTGNLEEMAEDAIDQEARATVALAQEEKTDDN